MKIILAAGIYPPDIGGPATYSKRLAEELKLPVVSYSQGLRKYPKGIKHLFYFLGLLWLARNTEVIYAQNVTSAGLPALFVSRLLRKKFVLKIVGDAAWEQKKEYLRKIQEYVAKHAHRIIVPSYYVKKMVTGWGALDHKIEVIYNAPETALQLNISKEEAKEKIGIEGDIILSAGRLAPWKGFDTLIEIMPDLLKENPNFCLVIVGEGAGKENIENQIRSLKLEGQVRLVGGVRHDQMSLYFRAANLFVLNTGYEGLSHVLLEVMQAGLPIVTTNIGGNPELIENGKNGILIEYNNKKQLKEAILRLMADEHLQEKFKQNSKEKLQMFTWQSAVDKTLEVFGSRTKPE